MLDVGYIDSVGGSVSGQLSQMSLSVSDSSDSKSVATTTLTDLDVVIPRIRVDTNVDRAILEYRSLKTGEVKRQFPTEGQLRAFQQAQRLIASNERYAESTKPTTKDKSTNTAMTSSGTSSVSDSSVGTVDRATVSMAVSSYAKAASYGTSSNTSSSFDGEGFVFA